MGPLREYNPDPYERLELQANKMADLLVDLSTITAEYRGILEAMRKDRMYSEDFKRTMREAIRILSDNHKSIEIVSGWLDPDMN